MKKIEELKLKKITILIPYLYKNLASKPSRIKQYIDHKNSKRHKKQKAVKLKNIMNFKYIKGSNLIEEKNLDFKFSWKHQIGKWKLKDKKFKNLEWTVQTATNYNHWIMASAMIEDHKNISDIFGAETFNKNASDNQIKKLLDSLIDLKDKKYKAFGQPQIFLEVDELPKSNKLELPPQTFHWWGDINSDSPVISESVISWFYDEINPGFIFSMPKENRYMAYNAFWMEQNRVDDTTVKKLFLKNCINATLFSKDMNWHEINEITLKRLNNHVKRAKDYENNQNHNCFIYGNSWTQNNRIDWSDKIKYNKIGDVNIWEKEAVERLEEIFEDLLLEKKEETKLNNIKHNRQVLGIAFFTMLTSLIAVIISACQ